jgi:bacterioferritin-associated ferredoxin
MIVCHCNCVSDRQIRTAVSAGACDEDDIARMCGAGTDCGGCLPWIDELLDGHDEPVLAFPRAS